MARASFAQIHREKHILGVTQYMPTNAHEITFTPTVCGAPLDVPYSVLLRVAKQI